MENKVKLVCEVCDKTFERAKREQKRNEKKGRKAYCSRSCSGKANIKNIPEDKRNIGFLNPGPLIDEFTPFRYHLRNAKSRDKVCSLTLEELKEVWESQKGKCIYTGINLKDWSSKKKSNSFYTASLDRIDSNKGYTKDNVQFVSRNINFMKNSLSHEKMVELCKILSNFWK